METRDLFASDQGASGDVGQTRFKRRCVSCKEPAELKLVQKARMAQSFYSWFCRACFPKTLLVYCPATNDGWQECQANIEVSFYD